MDRIDTIIVQPIITTYDDAGKPIHERAGQAMKLFKASQPDVWVLCDKLLEESQANTEGYTGTIKVS
jgi:predicted HAD superfamily phosphohydrolase YqeG